MKQITLMRRKVATMANRLTKMGMTLSAAFTRAWALIKGETITTKIKGVTYGNAQKALEHLTRYQPERIVVELERDKYNLYDSNAIAVKAGIKGKGVVKVGYLPAPLAKVISALLDKDIQVKALYGEIRGKYERYMNYGMVINLCL